MSVGYTAWEYLSVEAIGMGDLCRSNTTQIQSG